MNRFPETHERIEDDDAQSFIATYATTKARIDNGRSQIGPITDRLERVKEQLDTVINLGIDDLQEQDSLDFITRISDVATPEPIDDFVHIFHNIHTVKRMRAKLTVQAVQAPLQTAETVSALVAKSIAALNDIAHYKRVDDASLNRHIEMQKLGDRFSQGISMANNLFINEAIRQCDATLNVYVNNDHVLDKQELKKFKEQSDGERSKQLKEMWEGITSGSAASRDFSVQKKKLEGILHVLRWPWFEALEAPALLLRDIQKEVEQMLIE
ncbi:hypothetical protein N0V95_001693 [Ascochyta clinopodiicola]|nr:hypothetical protein N0V95_001693 [Ascochyta clinopodiicola]